MEPIVNGLEGEYGADVVFDYLNAADERGQAAMTAYALRGHPSYVLLDENGDVLWQLTGQTQEAQLRFQLTAAQE